MIYKLKEKKGFYNGLDVINKLNELIDEVNNLRIKLDNLKIVGGEKCQEEIKKRKK